TVTADPKSKVLGAADPALTYQVTTGSVVTGDSLGGALSRDAGEAIGSYPIRQGTVAGSGNYTLSFVGSTLTVGYATSGNCLGSPGHAILQPVNTDGTSVFKQGSTVPAKFRVCDANGNSVGTPGVVRSFIQGSVSAGVVTTVNETVDSTTPDTAFRWDPTAQQWIFNMSTKSLQANKTYSWL